MSTSLESSILYSRQRNDRASMTKHFSARIPYIVISWTGEPVISLWPPLMPFIFYSYPQYFLLKADKVWEKNATRPPRVGVGYIIYYILHFILKYGFSGFWRQSQWSCFRKNVYTGAGLSPLVSLSSSWTSLYQRKT